MIGEFDPAVIEEAARWLLRSVLNEDSRRKRADLPPEGAFVVDLTEAWTSSAGVLS